MLQVPASSSEAVDDLQDRIGRFARFAFIFAGAIFVIGRGIALAESGELTTAEFSSPNRIAYVTALIVLLAAWQRCLRARMTTRTLRVFDAALTIAISTCWGMLGWGPGPSYPVSLTMPVTHTLIGRSVIVPSDFRRTLWISSVAALPTVYVIVTHHALLHNADRVRIVLAISWCALAVAIAALNSKSLYGLRKQIGEVRRLGQYTLEEKIGEGGMGVVYRATHAMLRRPAAIKLLLKECADESDLVRFEREVQLTSRLAHPNTVSIFDYGLTSDGVFYYAMEYIDGMDLDRLVQSDGPLEASRAINILAQVCGALAEAHTLGLVHRDIKPANIVLTARADEPDVVKVVDFGLARCLTRNQSVTASSTGIIGTPLYMAPEAVASPDTVDGRADLYALGAVAYFLLTGKAVFEAPSVVEVCGKHLFEVPIPPSERLGRVLSPDLEALVLKCLAKDRDVRPRSAAALREAFLKCEDANRYDPRTSHAWWHDRRAVLRASGSSSSWSESNPLSTLTVSRSAENSRPAKGA